MFIGHLAVGFAAKRAAPRTTLGLLMAAPLLLDLIGPLLVLAGAERVEIVHRPDLPLYPGSAASAGLGLWNSVGGTIILESSMFLAVPALGGLV